MTEENEWDQITDVHAAEGPKKTVTVDEVITVLRKMKSGKATGPWEVDSEMINASGDTWITVMVELC